MFTKFWCCLDFGVFGGHCVLHCLHLNPIQPGGGGGGTLCPPPQVHFLKYLKNALIYGLETFWQFKWTKFQNKNLFFNRLRPPLVTIATVKVDACFNKTHFGSFHAKGHQNSTFFCYFYEECLKCNLWWSFGLDILFDGVLVTIFVLHSFSCFNDLKLDNTIPMATRMVSFDLVFYKLWENVTFVDSQQGEQEFWFLNRDSQSKIWKLWTTLKR